MEDKVARIVVITEVRNDAQLVCDAEQGPWCEPIVVENVEIGVKRGKSLNESNLQVRKRNQLQIHESVTLHISWRPVHDVQLR